MGMNPFGRIETGELRVSGFLKHIAMPVIIDTKTDNSLSVWQKYCPELPELRMRFLVDMEDEVAVGAKVALLPVSVFPQGMRRGVLDDKLGQDSQEWEAFQRIVGDNTGANCLLLVATDSASSIYKRVGVVQTWELHCFHGCGREELTII